MSAFPPFRTTVRKGKDSPTRDVPETPTSLRARASNGDESVDGGVAAGVVRVTKFLSIRMTAFRLRFGMRSAKKYIGWSNVSQYSLSETIRSQPKA